jgi:hypothetical protein
MAHTPLSIAPEHLALARAWAQWNGQRGTDAQALRIAMRTPAAALQRMLAARGINVVS